MMKPSVETFFVNGLAVEYKLQRAKDDRTSLLVIFSGFRTPGTYDFDGAPALSLRGNILWIQDQFKGDFSYYMCQDMDFAISDAVQTLIEHVLVDLRLDKSNCILSGFSKGGTAAIYHGIKYDYRVIVASVPQFRIGTYMDQYWPRALKAMVGDRGDRGRELLDDILPSMIAEDANRDRHIYMISSCSDELHRAQVEPFVAQLRRYSGFNYVLTDSPLVQDHIAVTRYNVPFLTGLFALLMEGILPRIGEVENGSSSSRLENSNLLDTIQLRREVVSQLTSWRLEGGRFYPSGYAFVKGFEASRYGCVSTRLVLTSRDESVEFALGGVREPSLSTRFYEYQFCDYSYGGFSTLKHEGIDLADLPVGTYRIEVLVSHGPVYGRAICTSGGKAVAWSLAGNRLAKYESTEASSKLVVRPLIGKFPDGSFWSLTHSWARGTILHIEGHFAVEGYSADSYADVDYYLSLASLDGDRSDVAFELAVGNRSGASEYFGDPWVDYSKAYYATPQYRGIDIAGLQDGSYALRITARFRDALFTRHLRGALTIEQSTISRLELSE